jgi:hypothetical protein
MKTIIGLSGSIGVGKSAAAAHLVQRGFVEYCFADPLKDICRILGFSQQQVRGTQAQKLEINTLWGVSGREFMQKFGTEIMREQLPRELGIKINIWVDLLALRISEEKNDKIVVSDVRFDDEAKKIKEMGGIVIKITRGGVEASGHLSERGISTYDLELFNDGTDKFFSLLDEKINMYQTHSRKYTNKQQMGI